MTHVIHVTKITGYFTCEDTAEEQKLRTMTSSEDTLIIQDFNGRELAKLNGPDIQLALNMVKTRAGVRTFPYILRPSSR